VTALTLSSLPSLPSLPGPDELLAAAHVVRIPLVVRFRGLLEREAVLLHGPAGWGEFAPFVEYGDPESARWLAAGVEAAWDRELPGAVRNRVPVNATVPAVPAADVAGVLARFAGCTTAKVKVAEAGQSLDDDVARVAAVRDALGPGGRVRVDANGGWSVPDAVRALAALSRYELEYAEQPCPSIDDLRDVRVALARAGIDLRVAADESVRRAEDPLRVALSGAADVVVLKVAPLGGVQAALRVAQVLGAEHGIPVVVSSALDTSIGISAGVTLAAALPELPFACGLGTASLLAADVVAQPLTPVDGSLPVGRVAADAGRLAELAVAPGRRAWWLDRLARCQALLAGLPARTRPRCWPGSRSRHWSPRGWGMSCSAPDRVARRWPTSSPGPRARRCTCDTTSGWPGSPRSESASSRRPPGPWSRRPAPRRRTCTRPSSKRTTPTGDSS
jgi:O-succinylbenzoate synthase